MKVFTTKSIDEGKQLAAWREFMSDVYFSLEIKSEMEDGFRGRIKEMDIGPVSITSLDCDQQRAFRTKQRISTAPDDSFVFVMPVRKDLYFNQLGRNGVVQPGGYVLLSTSEFYELSCPDGYLNWTVKMPGMELRRRIPDIEDYCGRRLPNNFEMATLARHHARAVALTFGSVDAPNQEALAANLIDFFALLIGSEEDSANSERLTQYRLRKRIINYIRSNLREPELTPRRIANDCGISLSYLYKVFQKSGYSVGKFIQQERLQSAYEQLALPGKSEVTVAEAGYTAGFRNVSHFSKVFSQKFGIPPSMVYNRPAGADAKAWQREE